ncbi:MAG TPA: DUF368 domain-containing protein, partial [Thermoplasmatales archaeon]|nr:DUF368 domain-containing protein [Thermoplasmatales archaeon]
MNNARRAIGIFIRGLFMGAADIIPGISGGTIAFITGIYEELVFAIKSIDLRIVFYLPLAIVNERYYRRFKEGLRSINFAFLLPLLAGIVLSFLSLVHIVGFLIDNYRVSLYAFFFGLILSSAFVLYARVEHKSFLHLIPVLLGFLFAYVFLGFEGLELNHTLPIIFISGAVTICAMILPGISGAFILLFL